MYSVVLTMLSLCHMHMSGTLPHEAHSGRRRAAGRSGVAARSARGESTSGTANEEREGNGLHVITVPPGRVTLSDRRTQRSWSVELAPYQIAAFPVTQARYAQVTGERPSTALGRPAAR